VTGSTRARWLLAGAIAGLAGCATPERPNVVLVTFDTTRADHLSTYGYEKPTSPELSRIARGGVIFEDCLSAVPITFPSHSTILTGTFPTRHGGRDNGGFYLADQTTTLPELLQADGYSTAAFVSGFPLDSRYNLDQGFDVYDDEFEAELTELELRRRELNTLQITQRRGDITTRRALAWMRKARAPLFVWVHYYDPHAAYDPPPPYNQLFYSEPYDGEIAFADSNLGRLWRFASQAGWAERAIWAITADHGESLGDHGELTHATLAYQSTLHVPLVMRLPGPAAPPRRVREPVLTADITPTILDLLGLSIPATTQGRSLTGLLRGATATEAQPPQLGYFECLLPYLHFGWSPLSGVRDGRWKYIASPEPELYDLVADPSEVTNLAARQPQRAQRLAAEVRRFQSDPATAPGTERDQEAMAKLIALGYAGATAAGNLDQALSDLSGYPNPVEQMGVMDRYNVARQLFSSGDFEAALEAARQALLIDPDNRELLWFSARCRTRLGDMEAAQKEAQRALAIDPQDTRVLALLANLAFEQQDYATALHYLERWVAADPSDLSAHHLMGISLARRGDLPGAESAYRKALDIDVSHVDSRVNLAGVLLEQERAREARAEMRRALREAPYSARVHYNLGNLELSQERPEAARQAFARALSLDPNYPLARIGLALTLAQLGRKGEAIQLVQVLESSQDTEIAAQARELLSRWQSGGE